VYKTKQAAHYKKGGFKMADLVLVHDEIQLRKTQEEVAGFKIPKGWKPADNQWQSRDQTGKFLSSKKFGCAGCTKKKECQIRKEILTAMGEDYPFWPAPWLVISSIRLRSFRLPSKRILCNDRVVENKGSDTL
jgi:hypothetical protein